MWAGCQDGRERLGEMIPARALAFLNITNAIGTREPAPIAIGVSINESKHIFCLWSKQGLHRKRKGGWRLLTGQRRVHRAAGKGRTKSRDVFLRYRGNKIKMVRKKRKNMQTGLPYANSLK